MVLDPLFFSSRPMELGVIGVSKPRLSNAAFTLIADSLRSDILYLFKTILSEANRPPCEWVSRILGI